MGPAGDFHHALEGEHGVVAGVGVGLEGAAPAGEERLGPLLLARGCIVVDDEGVVLIPDIDPVTPRTGAAFERPVEDAHGRVVGVEDRRLQEPARHLAHDRLEEAAAEVEPVLQGRARDLQAVALEDVLLAVEREVVLELAHSHVGDEARAGQALLDRLRRHGRQHHGLLALGAGVLRALVHADEQRRGAPLQLLALLVADVLEPPAALRTDLLGGREGMLDTLARQALGQPPTPVAILLRLFGRRRQGRLDSARLGLLLRREEREHELRRVHPLRARAELVPAEERQTMLEHRDLGVLPLQRLGQGPHQLLEERHIARQVVEVYRVHTLYDHDERANAAKNSRVLFSPH